MLKILSRDEEVYFIRYAQQKIAIRYDTIYTIRQINVRLKADGMASLMEQF